MKRWFLALGSMLLLATTVHAQDVKKEKPKSGGSNLITQAEIEYANVGNAYEAIQRLRPSMLRKRVGSSVDKGEGGEIVVFLDGAKYGYPDQLSSISSDRIKEIRFINGPDATTRFGTNYTEGVILVTTKMGPK